MILDKYQVYDSIEKRGYSVTGKVQNEFGDLFFAKWISGIKKNSQPSKILSDKLRHLKKATHTCLPKIIEYGWDDQENAFCIISEHKDAETLENFNYEIEPVYYLKGIEQVVECLQLLQQKYRLVHGDITPANILVDDEFSFYLIDFGISDISVALSQESNLEVFARAFSAPEKWNPKAERGFPYQADIYSVGKVIEWYASQHGLGDIDQLKDLINACCAVKPSDRCNYSILQESIRKIVSEIPLGEENYVYVSSPQNMQFMDEIANEECIPRFKVSTSPGDHIFISVATQTFIAECLWKLDEHCIDVMKCFLKDEEENKYRVVSKYGVTLPMKANFRQKPSSLFFVHENSVNLTPFFRKLQREENRQRTYREGKKGIFQELDFYKELLNKEKAEMEKAALKLKYTSFDMIDDYEIHFKVKPNDQSSKIGHVFSHIDSATDKRSDGFEYILGESENKKQLKDPYNFSGIAYDFENEKNILKFKDCERLNIEEIPKSGYIFENISKQEEEKNRQLEAIRKVEYNEAQNRDLIHYLFNPAELEGGYIEGYNLENVFQTDDHGEKFQYSPNQMQAVVNALNRKPLSVIQGPPGTGKTTVITEIVLQLLDKNPDAKILITSQTNDAVDHVLDNLLKKDVPLIRLSGIKKPELNNLKKHTLERKIEGWKRQVSDKAGLAFDKTRSTFFSELEKDYPALRPVIEVLFRKETWEDRKRKIENYLGRFSEYQSLQDQLSNEELFVSALEKTTKKEIAHLKYLSGIHDTWLAAVSSLNEKSNINQKLVNSIRVIGATCNHIASKKYSNYDFDFDYVIMDESGKATTAEALVPIVLGNNLVFVGDHRQLRPMLTSNREIEKWLRKKYNTDKEFEEFDSWDDYFNRPSLFEHVIENIDQDFKSQLTECRRSSADQVRLTSECFYECKGDEAIEAVPRHSDKEHNLDLYVDSSIIFFDIGHSYKSEQESNRSSFNTISAKLIPEILKKLDQFAITKRYSIGIITGYKAQLRRVRNIIRKHFTTKSKLRNVDLNNTAISVVDKFQGLEKDIIIFDLVRTGHDGQLGFLANDNRINVALSRQKRLLIIVGDFAGLSNARSYNGDNDTGLHKYMRKMKHEWIITSTSQLA